MQNFTRSEDPRRSLYDWADGDFKCAKALIVKKPVPIGNHYHNKKTETFFLLSGRILGLRLGDEITQNIDAPYKFTVLPGVYHTIVCETGSILLCVADHPYDPKDEIK